MKQLSACFPLFLGLILIVCTVPGCVTTSETERPQVCTVVTVSGEARYWDGQSNKVHIIKEGDQIPPGSIIETAKGAGNWVDLATGKRLLTVYSNYPYVFDPPDSLRVNEDSVLKLDKVALKTAGEIRFLDARLYLLRGSILIETIGRLQEPFLQAGLITANRDKSHWSLKAALACSMRRAVAYGSALLD
jgi:hypothetical protein